MDRRCRISDPRIAPGRGGVADVDEEASRTAAGNDPVREQADGGSGVALCAPRGRRIDQRYRGDIRKVLNDGRHRNRCVLVLPEGDVAGLDQAPATRILRGGRRRFLMGQRLPVKFRQPAFDTLDVTAYPPCAHGPYRPCDGRLAQHHRAHDQRRGERNAGRRAFFARAIDRRLPSCDPTQIPRQSIYDDRIDRDAFQIAEEQCSTAQKRAGRPIAGGPQPGIAARGASSLQARQQKSKAGMLDD